MKSVTAPTKVKWNEIIEVGMPTVDLRTVKVGPHEQPRTFLCRGEWSIFTSPLHFDGSGFVAEESDVVKAWAIIDGY
jgi:hypothetical protein